MKLYRKCVTRFEVDLASIKHRARTLFYFFSPRMSQMFFFLVELCMGGNMRDNIKPIKAKSLAIPVYIIFVIFFGWVATLSCVFLIIKCSCLFFVLAIFNGVDRKICPFEINWALSADEIKEFYELKNAPESSKICNLTQKMKGFFCVEGNIDVIRITFLMTLNYMVETNKNWTSANLNL